jgi:hypothetical protein
MDIDIFSFWLGWVAFGISFGSVLVVYRLFRRGRK